MKNVFSRVFFGACTLLVIAMSQGCDAQCYGQGCGQQTWGYAPQATYTSYAQPQMQYGVQQYSTQQYTQQYSTQQYSAQQYSQQYSSQGSVHDALAIVNQRRAARGLYPLSFDPTLASTAQYKSQARANRRMSGHDGSNKAGAMAEGVGYAYGSGNLNNRFQTCHLYSTGYRSAGAAIAYDSRGAAYFTLLLR